MYICSPHLFYTVIVTSDKVVLKIVSYQHGLEVTILSSSRIFLICSTYFADKWAVTTGVSSRETISVSPSKSMRETLYHSGVFRPFLTIRSTRSVSFLTLYYGRPLSIPKKSKQIPYLSKIMYQFISCLMLVGARIIL